MAKSSTSRKPAGKVNAALQSRAGEVYRRLEALYPDATCALIHRSAFELLIATILSAQCTDARVNIVTPGLFKKYPTPKAFAEAPIEELEQAIRSTGFYRNKAKSIQGAAHLIARQHGNQVPSTMEDLLELPGVARKTANVVLGNAFNINEGVVVDTHVGRVSGRLGLTKQKDPVKVENDLVKLFPRDRWTMLAHLLIYHGRQVCIARRPLCERCTLADICPKIGVAPEIKQAAQAAKPAASPKSVKQSIK